MIVWIASGLYMWWELPGQRRWGWLAIVAGSVSFRGLHDATVSATTRFVAPDPRVALGCMRLSTETDRDDDRALGVLHAAFDAGITLLDTADAYCLGADDTGHNERLIARAIASWTGERSRIRVATKGGLTRPQGGWIPDGRARHLIAACEASRRALGVERIHLYQLHAPDPRTPLTTSVRALAALKRDGRIEFVGLCNVNVGQIEEARRITEIDASPDRAERLEGRESPERRRWILRGARHPAPGLPPDRRTAAAAPDTDRAAAGRSRREARCHRVRDRYRLVARSLTPRDSCGRSHTRGHCAVDRARDRDHSHRRRPRPTRRAVRGRATCFSR